MLRTMYQGACSLEKWSACVFAQSFQVVFALFRQDGHSTGDFEPVCLRRDICSWQDRTEWRAIRFDGTNSGWIDLHLEGYGEAKCILQRWPRSTENAQSRGGLTVRTEQYVEVVNCSRRRTMSTSQPCVGCNCDLTRMFYLLEIPHWN